MQTASKWRILVVCPTEWERAAMASGDLQSRYDFALCGEELCDRVGLWTALRFSVPRFLDQVTAQQRDRGIDGVLGTGDYPGCLLSALLAERLGLRGPRARDITLLSHKYYSRLFQQRFVPEATPRFEALYPRIAPTLDYPFFVKPMKGTMSLRAQMVHSPAQLEQAVALSLGERLGGFVLLRPFEALLRTYVPDAIPARRFIAEAPLRGHQVTVDGFVQSGRATVMGIVDSIMYPGTISFRRFEYPSTLPAVVQARMSELATRLMEGIGFDHSCFNIEMFYDPTADTISIIEINPRMSYQFSDLFAYVNGMSSFSVQLALITGTPVSWPDIQAPERAAASFVLRRFRDARVRAVPTQQRLDELAQTFPEMQVKILCRVGQRLSAQTQDVGSYRYCIVNLGAPSRGELLARFERIEQSLPFVFEE